jgi:hypothetical protein
MSLRCSTFNNAATWFSNRVQYAGNLHRFVIKIPSVCESQWHILHKCSGCPSTENKTVVNGYRVLIRNACKSYKFRICKYTHNFSVKIIEHYTHCTTKQIRSDFFKKNTYLFVEEYIFSQVDLICRCVVTLKI